MGVGSNSRDQGSTSQMTFDQEEHRSHMVRGSGGGGAAHTRSQHPGLGSTTGQCPGRGPSAPAHSAGEKTGTQSPSGPDSPFMIEGTEASVRSHCEAGPGTVHKWSPAAGTPEIVPRSPWFPYRHRLLSLQQSVDAVVMSFPSGGREGVVSALI